jgi:hypothetical protein
LDIEEREAESEVKHQSMMKKKIIHTWQAASQQSDIDPQTLESTGSGNLDLVRELKLKAIKVREFFVYS